MFFGKLDIEKTGHTIVAHSIQLKHRKLKKGHIIAEQDITDLKEAGYKTIVVARLDDGDIDENTAAKTLAETLANESLQLGQPFTGRCNLESNFHGLLQINQAGIDAINQVDESITIASLPQHTVVKPGELVATVKIIPFAVAANDLEASVQAAQKENPVIQVLPFKSKMTGIIQTRLPGTSESVLDKTTDVLKQRLEILDSRIIEEIRVDHDETELTKAINTLLKKKVDILMVIGASAIVDLRDIIPTAIIQAGGDILRFGMPTDPGNLLLLAKHGNVPVLGLPGCARSPKRNGLDIVLERLVADIPVTSADIKVLGTGGLLKEIKSRPQPRAGKK